MPHYEIDIQASWFVEATLTVRAKDKRHARRIAKSRINRAGHKWQIAAEHDSPRKIVEITEVQKPRKVRTPKPGSIITPRPPKEFCANCGLNEVFHPSKKHGSQTACEKFRPPSWVKRPRT